MSIPRFWRYWRHVFASWRYPIRPTVTSFFVAWGASWRSRCLIIRASHFGARDSPTCAKYAFRPNATDNETNFPEAVRSVKNNFYKNDYLELSPTVEEAIRKAQDLVKVITKGGFTLTKFASNVVAVLSALSRMEYPINGNVKVLAAGGKSCHVLRLEWNYRFDTLVVSRGTSADRNRTLTQRVVLSLVSAGYNPIGLVTPYTVKAWLLMKNIWRRSSQQWYDNLPDHFVDKIVKWIDELRKLTKKTISRGYFEGQADKVKLHIFGESSQDVFSSVDSFWRKWPVAVLAEQTLLLCSVKPGSRQWNPWQNPSWNYKQHF